MLPAFADGPRLRLRPLEKRDAAALVRVRDDPEVARYQNWTRYSLADATALIAEMARRGPDARGEWLQLAVTVRATGELIGDCGFRSMRADPTQAEIGFTIGRPWQGRGYGAEAAGLLADWLLAAGRRRLFAVVDGRNRPSHRMLERLGFRRDPSFDRLTWFKGEFGPEGVWVRERSSA